MNVATLLNLAQNGLVLVLMLSAVPVLAAMVVGLVVSVIQSATQLQDSTVSTVPKIAAVAAALLIAGPWMLKQLFDFAAAWIGAIGGQ